MNFIESQWLFDTISIQDEWGNCKSSEEGCITVSLNFIQIHDADSIGQIINDQILHLLLGNNSDSFESAEAYSNHLIKEYRIFSKESDKATGWQIENEIQLEYASNQIVSVRQESFEYIGIAPSVGVALRSFSQLTGDRIFLRDVFKENYQDSLMYLCRYHLKRTLESNLDLNFDESDLNEEKQFKLSEQFLLNETGISFLYLDISLLSSGSGWIEFTIPYSELIEADILDEKGVLGFLLGSVNL